MRDVVICAQSQLSPDAGWYWERVDVVVSPAVPRGFWPGIFLRGGARQPVLVLLCSVGISSLSDTTFWTVIGIELIDAKARNSSCCCQNSLAFFFSARYSLRELE